VSLELQPYQAPSALQIETPTGDLEREKTAQTIQNAALLTAAIAAEPLPWVDLIAIVPLQIKLVTDIGAIHGLTMTPQRARQILLELGGTLAYAWAARQITRGILKIAMPVLGGLLNAPLMYANTYTLGHLAERYFRAQRGDLPPLSDEAKAEWSQTLLAEGKKLAAHFTMDDLRRALIVLGKVTKR
jgi:uncharacterized protein (DUF697 family)